MSKTPSIYRRFRGDTSGQFAVWVGLSALPILALTTAVIDYSKADALRNGLQNALDSAALAAVTEQTLTPSERADYARDYFSANFANSDKFVLTPLMTTGENVKLMAEGSSPISVSAALGRKDIKVSATSESKLTKGATICIMTINPDGKDSFTVSDGADFDASTCAVQVNSTNKDAASVSSGASATAQRFCIRGGAAGDFSPYVNTECSLIADPYAGKSGPQADACIKVDLPKTVEAAVDGITGELVDVVANNAVLNPGTYCKNLKVKGLNITFNPGVYIFDDASLKFEKGSQAMAEDVTFVLRGSKSDIKVDGGSSLYIKAPSNGDLAGLAIFQQVSTDITGKKGKGKGSLPNGKTELKGGSTMTILGTVYVPEHDIIVKSDSGLGTQSPATSFIGYNVNFSGNSKITVAVDSAAVGLPPILPSADEGARLIR